MISPATSSDAVALCRFEATPEESITHGFLNLINWRARR